MNTLSKRWYKLTNWEFWSFNVFYFPIKVYYAFLALRNRSFFFFTAANPSIDFGGMMGEQKSAIYALIPEKYLPKMKLLKAYDETSGLLFANELRYPVIVKPNIGERGNWVEKIDTKDQLRAYIRACPADFFIQEFVDLPVELGVFFVKMPGEKGRVTSLVMKQFLTVTGDGNSTVSELLAQNPRALLQLDFSHPRFEKIMKSVPKSGDTVKVEPIGNHCRATIFLNLNHEIDEQLNAAFNTICDQIEGFYYGRFDLRCASIVELRQLRDFKILELNGAGAEPAHIYHPGSSLLRAYRDVIWHFNQLSKISRANHRRGVAYWGFRSGIKKMKEVAQYNAFLMKKE